MQNISFVTAFWYLILKENYMELSEAKQQIQTIQKAIDGFRGSL